MKHRSKEIYNFVFSCGRPVTAEEVAANLGLTPKAASQRLLYLCNMGVLARNKENNVYYYSIKDYSAMSYSRPYSVYKEKTATGTIVRFGDKWKPERAIKPTGLYGGVSSIEID